MNTIATLLSSMAEITVQRESMDEFTAQAIFEGRIPNLRRKLSRGLDSTWDQRARDLLESLENARTLKSGVKDFIGLRILFFCEDYFKDFKWHEMSLHDLEAYGFEFREFGTNNCVHLSIPYYLVPVFPKGTITVKYYSDIGYPWKGTEEYSRVGNVIDHCLVVRGAL